MATVYLAVTSGNNGLDFSKLVVIKRLREHVAADPDFVTMLEDEARIAARLNHQNVVQTIEVGEHDGELFIGMEFLDGQPLHRIQRRAGADFPIDMHLTVLSDVLAGMHYAHELRDFDGKPLNVVHRDITPHNIFVTYDGQVKVLDFGIAKAEGRSSTTKHGVVKGKLAYMSPEQARGHPLDRRTDIFSAGIMLFEIVTGQRYWGLLSDSEMLRALIQGKHPRSPRERVETVDARLDEICSKALAVAPEDRYATADDFAVDLDDYLNDHRLRVRPRQLGIWLADVFADRRELTRQILEEQIELVRASPSTDKIASLRARVVDKDEVDIDVDEDEEEADGSFSDQATRLLDPGTQLSLQSHAEMAYAATAPLVIAAAPLTGSRERRTRLLIYALVALVALVVLVVAAIMGSVSRGR